MTYLLIWLSGWVWWLLIGPLLLILLIFPDRTIAFAALALVVGMIALLFVVFVVFVTASPEWQNPTTGKTFPNPLGLSVIPAALTFEAIQLPWRSPW